MSPKSLLRHKEAISDIADLAQWHFHNVLDETDDLDKDKIETIEVLKGSKAVEKYGEKARNGVVVITSKK